MIVDPARVCELLVGLGDVTVLGADDDPGEPVRRPCRDPCRAAAVSGVRWCGVGEGSIGFAHDDQLRDSTVGAVGWNVIRIRLQGAAFIGEGPSRIESASRTAGLLAQLIAAELDELLSRPCRSYPTASNMTGFEPAMEWTRLAP